MKRNLYISAALEGLETGAVTETSITPQDSVAELQQQNATMDAENAELRDECFENDTDAIAEAGDEMQGDLAEANKAVAALEELAHICEMTVKSGQANKASVASLAFGLEQICARAKIPNPVSALEDGAADASAAEQTEAVGDAAKSKSKEILARLAAAAKRIVAWIVGLIRKILSRSMNVAEEAKKLIPQVGSINSGLVIEDEKFIKSLRLVADRGDANQQFKAYGALATKTLYGFFNDAFVSSLNELSQKGSNSDQLAIFENTAKVLKGLQQHVFDEPGVASDLAEKPELPEGQQLRVSLTEPMIGGVRLYLAYSAPISEKSYLKAGLSPKQPEIVDDDTIVVADPHLAKNMLDLIVRWADDQKALEDRLQKIEGFAKVAEGEAASKYAAVYLKVLTTVATAVIPQLLRLNLQNSTNYVRYVQKSIAVSKAR
ncbi:hypothetical protein [Ralstonia phage RP31]|uniref:Uncharacterized protein n=2 Tax=Ripduovirus RP12 TaxID=2560700 RepID=A0A1L7N152_9CAUD|nr:hypothetical protein FDH28_gp184 [Ralstonia phage RP12]BAW19211.1 hypothetical protein [Ralstonia phage RP12]BAW19497.1 hypothetical protein [Ralstonia phage RP31]